MTFQLESKYKPQGDQPLAIKELSDGVLLGAKAQTLLGATGSGKTFTMANVIQKVNKPTLIISHNKTLAAQLYGEFKGFFPHNAVEYFISYYDYYQPEAYIPTTDTYIEKDASINDDIDRLRLKATSSLLSRKDVIVVASVSCIYGIGSPEDYLGLLVQIESGKNYDRNELLLKLISIQYTRNDFDFHRGTFRIRGDIIDIFPAYDEFAYRLEFFGDELETIKTLNPKNGKTIQSVENIMIFPAKHFVTTHEKMQIAKQKIKQELNEQLKKLRTKNKLLEAQRLEMRTNFDLEMMEEIGYCSGIENYSRHISGREAGEPGATLIDFFPDDFLMMIDESHQTVPQIRAMYNGDRSRKETLVEYGFRLPSALDNRPLKFPEFESRRNQVIYVSATPADYELQESEGVIVEQVIRPTGLIDPEIEIRPISTQVDDLIDEIKIRAARNERTLVTTLTKRMAEDLTDYLQSAGINVRYLHSEIQALDRIGILRDLRLAEFDVLVGINLLREGLDLPEVSLVAVLDADKEGFLRSYVSLMQTAGRAARNVEGRVIFYADKMTDSIRKTMDESLRRRNKQIQFNRENNITPQTILKSTQEILESTSVADISKSTAVVAEPSIEYNTSLDKDQLIKKLQEDMKSAALNLEFEKAAALRDEIQKLEKT
jgi:excinuclease ABC subunit B